MSIFHDQASLMQKARQQLHEKAVNPYAVGMAAAMKQTGDKPPLKKSTITKAHKIAKKVEKAGYEPEGDQLSEKEDSPYEKASDAALDKRYGYGRASGGKRSFGRAANRSSAAAALRAIRRGERSGSGTSTEAGADAVHRGWAHTARTSEDQTPEKKARRAKLANTDYKDLPDDEKEKDRVSFNAVKAVHKARKNNLSSSYEPEGEMVDERIRLSYVPPGNPNYERDDEGNVKLSRANLKKKAGKTLRTLIGGGKDRGSIRIRFGEETQIDEGKADKKLPEHERSAARLKRYDNPSGALALGGGQQRARRAEHESRRGVKKEDYKIDEVTLSPRAQAINSGNSPLSRDPRARGGYDPRFDRRPTQTASPSPTSTGSAPTRPTTPTSAPSTGTYRSPNTGGTTPGGSSPSSPRMPGGGGGILDTLDKFGRDTAGRVGETIGREKASKVPGANIPGLGDIIKGEGGRRGRNQGQQMYDKAKETLGGFLKQNYEYEIINHLVENGFANDGMSAYKIMENMSDSWTEEIITELNRLEREQGKESGGNPDKAYQHVKKMIRGMEGKPAGQRKKVPGKKPPAAGEYGAPRSPAQKVAMRRAAKKRSDEMQSSTYD